MTVELSARPRRRSLIPSAITSAPLHRGFLTACRTITDQYQAGAAHPNWLRFTFNCSLSLFTLIATLWALWTSL
jgi:hypothetical protein